jgi:hypothetical protein
MIEMPVFQIFRSEVINLAKMFQNTEPTLVILYCYVIFYVIFYVISESEWKKKFEKDVVIKKIKPDFEKDGIYSLQFSYDGEILAAGYGNFGVQVMLCLILILVDCAPVLAMNA